MGPDSARSSGGSHEFVNLRPDLLTLELQRALAREVLFLLGMPKRPLDPAQLGLEECDPENLARHMNLIGGHGPPPFCRRPGWVIPRQPPQGIVPPLRAGAA